MNSRINSVMMRMVMLLGIVTSLAACAAGQGINLDFDIGIGDPELGNGAPSSSFGAAAGQPGFWNRVIFGASPVHLLGTDGQSSSVVMTAESSGSFGGIGFRNETNTGDFALLLNDAAQVATLSTGGYVSYNFTGLNSGSYQVYTYAVSPSGETVETPVHIAAATKNQTQTVTGPMPGNAFGYLITHSVHEVVVGPNGFDILVVQPPAHNSSMFINGIQIAPVPEPLSFISIPLFCSLLLIRKRHNN